MVISGSLIKELRELTGAGIMDCKRALTDANGDLKAAVDIIKSAGLNKAVKKSGRVAHEGGVAFEVSQGKGVILELNSETDFVARNEVFQNLIKSITSNLKDFEGTTEEALSYNFSAGKTIKDEITQGIASLGENIVLRRFGYIKADGLVVGYTHRELCPGVGRIGVIVGTQGVATDDESKKLLRSIAIHIAAMGPSKVGVYGEPEAINGDEITLLNQDFVLDESFKIGDLLIREAERTGNEVAISDFIRYELGQGN